MWDLRALAQLQGWGWVYETFKLNPLVVKHSVVVMTAGSHQDDPKLNAMGRQF